MSYKKLSDMTAEERANAPRRGRLTKRSAEARFRRVTLMMGKGMSLAEIAEKIGLKDETRLNRIVKTGYFKEKWEKAGVKAAEQARLIFEANAKEAAEKIARLSRQGQNKDRIQFEASKEILYQVGCKPVEVIETRRRDYTPQEIESTLITVQEVEQITDRLSTGNNKFVLPKLKDTTPEVSDTINTVDAIDTTSTEAMTTPTHEQVSGSGI